MQRKEDAGWGLGHRVSRVGVRTGQRPCVPRRRAGDLCAVLLVIRDTLRTDHWVIRAVSVT